MNLIISACAITSRMSDIQQREAKNIKTDSQLHFSAPIKDQTQCLILHRPGSARKGSLYRQSFTLEHTQTSLCQIYDAFSRKLLIQFQSQAFANAFEKLGTTRELTKRAMQQVNKLKML